MKKVVKTKKKEVTNQDLAHLLGGLDSKFGNLDSKFSGLDSKINNFGKTLDIRITKLESYIKEGFSTLDNKLDYVDSRISNHIESLGRRIDDLAENKVSRVFYKELENRVLFLESKILSKSKK